MRLRSVTAGVIAGFLLVGCESPEPADNPEPETETELQFLDKKVTAFIGSGAEVVLTVSPEDKAADVEIVNSDDSVVEIADKTCEGGVITLTLSSQNLGTCTIAASLEDKYAECAVEVVPVSAEGISLDVQSLDLNVYEQYTFTVTITPEDTTAPVVEWTSSDETVAMVNHGVVLGRAEGQAIITATVGDVAAQCTVNVHEVKGESLTLDVTEKEIKEGETFIVTATILPENVTVKGMKWSVEGEEGVITFTAIDPKEDDNQTSAKVVGVAAGEAVLVVEAAGLKASCKVAVSQSIIPAGEVKVGDYYYSDGTWSDGGLLGYDPVDSTMIWADVKPAPEAGKTVIGIVFQTDTTRISATEMALGYKHGLVMALKGAHGKDSSETKYSFEYSFDHISNVRLGSSWYADVNGYDWTQAIISDYPGDKIQQCPAFDWTVTDFSPSAPVSSSGWYVPSIGQVWDLLANLGGSELAQALETLQTYGSDISYYYRDGASIKLSYDPLAHINTFMSQIPSAQKEEFKANNSHAGDGDYCELMSSSLYDNEEGNVCCFWIYTNGKFEPQIDWTDQPAIFRPILSF